jgi:hypothetical protein
MYMCETFLVPPGATSLTIRFLIECLVHLGTHCWCVQQLENKLHTRDPTINCSCTCSQPYSVYTDTFQSRGQELWCAFTAPLLERSVPRCESLELSFLIEVQPSERFNFHRGSTFIEVGDYPPTLLNQSQTHIQIGTIKHITIESTIRKSHRRCLYALCN